MTSLGAFVRCSMLGFSEVSQLLKAFVPLPNDLAATSTAVQTDDLPRINLSLTIRLADMTIDDQAPLCIECSIYCSQAQLPGATSLSRLKDTQRKVKLNGSR